jgi:deoxyribodipyrimidine photolyase-related protein
VKQRTGPFNALYWDFISRHHARFSKNPRMANITRVYEKFDDAEKARIAKSAQDFLDGLDSWV